MDETDKECDPLMKSSGQHVQLQENGVVITCVVCGVVGSLEILSKNLFQILVKTGTINVGAEIAKAKICSQCSSSVTLMDQAFRVQAVLSEKFQRRRPNGVNGTRTNSVTAQLIKPGNDINMPGDVDARWHCSSSDDAMPLVISDVRGDVQPLPDQGDDSLNGTADDPEDDLASADTDDSSLVPHMECEVFYHPALEDMLGNVTSADGTEVMKAPVSSDIPYAVSRWLPTSNLSERSFGSTCTDSTLSSNCKDKPRSSWKCPMCDVTFGSSPLLVEHVHSCHSDLGAEETMSCPFCTKQFPTYTQLDEHITQLHGDGTHSCQGCYNVFLRPALLRRHQQYCSFYKTYLEEEKLAARVESAGVGDSTCTRCLIQFADTQAVLDHVAECHTDSLAKKYNCEGCTAGYDKLKSLYAHQSECMMFSQIGNKESDLNCSVEFRCQGCNAASVDVATFQKHKESCSAVQCLLDAEVASVSLIEKLTVNDERVTSSDTLEQAVDTASYSSGSYSCPHCGIVCFDDAQLEIHVQSVHQDTQQCLLKCTGCQGGFMNKDALDAHSDQCRRIGAVVSSYPCPKCFISYEFKSLLDFHMSIHENSDHQPYRCVGCNGGFSTRTHLVAHKGKCGKYKLVLETDEINGRKSSKSGDVKELDSRQVVKTELTDMRDLEAKGQPFCCKLCSSRFSFFCDFQDHYNSCAVKVKVKEQVKDGYTLSQPEIGRINGMHEAITPSRSCTELLESIDYLAPDIPCPICGIDLKATHTPCQSASKLKVTRHMTGHDAIFKRFSCPGCNWGSSSQSRAVFVKHALLCRSLNEKFSNVEWDETRVRCPVCLVQFASIRECENHFTTHHVNSLKKAEARFTCEGCRAHHSTEAQLQSHMDQCLLYPRALSATGTGRACGVCAARFSKSDKCESHIKDHHVILPDVSCWCVFCNKKFKELRDIIRHVNTNCGLAQSICEQTVQLPNATQMMDPSVIIEGTDNKVDSGIKDYEGSDQETMIWDTSRGEACKFCGALTGSKVKTAQHMLIHTDPESKPHRCKSCNGGFSRLSALSKHEDGCRHRKKKALEKVGKESTHLDKACVESSTDIPTDIEIDLKSENGKLLLTCSTCKESFAASTDLAAHVQTVHGQAKHQCEGCRKVFDYEETLLEHKLHCGKDLLSEGQHAKSCNSADEEIDERKCLSCCVKFLDETSFLLHIASHEVSNVNKCSYCLTAFKSAADICMHMVNYHKIYLTTGVREEGDEDSDKDSDDDSDMELESTASKTSLVASRKSLSQITERSPKSAPRSKTPVRSIEDEPTGKSPITTPSDTRINISDFKYELLTGTKCPVCNRKFQTNAILKRHYGIHDGYYPAICLLCGIGFCKNSQLRNHKVKVHRTPKATDFHCTRCGGAFDQNFRFRKHQEVCICSKNDTVIQCLLCVRTFDTWQQLKSHAWTHLTKCSYCEDKITVQSRRVDHMISCVKNPLNKTGKTRTTQSRPSTAKSVSSPSPQLTLPTVVPKPEKKKIEKKKYKCKECCSQYATMKSLKRHETVHEQAEYRCRVCGGKFSSLLAKNRHILREHQSTHNKLIKAATKPEPPKVEPETVENQTFYMCTKCNEYFPNKQQKDAHNRTVHAADRRTFECKLCDKRFDSKFARRRHMQTSHTGSSAQPQSLVCHLCAKRFASNFAKLQHLKKIHNLTDSDLAPRKRRVCKVCGEAFEHKSELKVHKRAVHAQNSLSNSIDLAPDMLLVNDEKLLSPPKVRACKQCDKTFAHKAELKAHYRSEHEKLSSKSVENVQRQHEHYTIVESTVTTLSNAGPVLLSPTGLINTATTEGSEKVKIRVCKDCGKTYATKTELKAHRKAEHKEKKLELLPVPGEEIVGVPGEEMLTVNAQTVQMLEGIRPNDSVVDLTSDNEENGPVRKRPKLEPVVQSNNNSETTTLQHPFKCRHCPKTFKLRISLNQHHTKAHPWDP